jgi:hypothetical protein
MMPQKNMLLTYIRDFTDIEILQRFQESLPTLLKNQEGEMDHYFGGYSSTP